MGRRGRGASWVAGSGLRCWSGAGFSGIEEGAEPRVADEGLVGGEEEDEDGSADDEEFW